MAQLFGPSRYLTFEGFSVDESGKQHFLDATVAYRQACLRAIEYLKQFGKQPGNVRVNYMISQNRPRQSR